MPLACLLFPDNNNYIMHIYDLNIIMIRIPFSFNAFELKIYIHNHYSIKTIMILKILKNTIPPKSTSHSLFRRRKFVYDQRPIIFKKIIN